jgi:hypothetical protein
MEVDSDDLATELENQCNNLAKEGWEIFSIMPISSGNVVSGTGYYHTESIIITVRKK